jgi:hypothetical protein
VRAVTKALCACAVLPFAAAADGAQAAAERTKIRAIPPEADTYVSAEEPDRNFGGSRVLRADGSPQATTYLRFRLRGKDRSILGATLILHAHSGDRTGFAVRRVPMNDWRERALTFATAPKPSLRYASAKPVRRGAWSAVDVTTFVGDTDEAVTLAVTTRSPDGVAFRSRESRQRPMLVVRTRKE